MRTPEEQKIIDQKRALVEACQQQYNLPTNPNIDEELLLYENFPKSISIRLIFLILAYKQEVTNKELAKYSDQPAAMIRDLRNEGFIFKQMGERYQYRNKKGEVVRKILDFIEISRKNIFSDTSSREAKLKKGIKDAYIDSFELTNFFCINKVKFEELSKYKEIYFLGENGDGKTLLLQGMVYAFNYQLIEELANLNVPYIGVIRQMVKDSKLVTSSELNIKSNKNQEYTFLKNFFAYGIHRSRKSAKEPDEYGFGTLFSDDVYLRSPEEWLVDLDRLNFRQVTSIKFDEAVKMLQELLLENVKIKLNKAGTKLEFTERGTPIAFSRLSEGYKSVITWVVDMLSRLAENQPEVKRVQDFQGIVLVDEISLHLHPKWEFEIVKKLRGWFPNIQFIFTTHSPVNVMGASEDAVFFRLYKEEGETKVSDPFYASDMSHLMANSIITSPLFGLDSARMRTYDESTDLDTSTSYLHSLIRKEVSKQVQDMRDAGKKFISPATLDNIIKNVLDKHKKS